MHAHSTPLQHPQPGDPAPEGSSYIAASYVKWVEVSWDKKKRIAPWPPPATPIALHWLQLVVRGAAKKGMGKSKAHQINV